MNRFLINLTSSRNLTWIAAGLTALAGLLMLGSVWLEAAGESKPPIKITLEPSRADAVKKFDKFEVSFTIDGTTATLLQWPYDATPPNGIPPGQGITVNGVFVDPQGVEYTQPAFYYQRFLDDVRNGRDWHYPTSEFAWKVRFSPNQVGVWKYRVPARDRNGTAETDWRTFTVSPSTNHGFVRVSQADPRYFEFDDGTFFSGLGFQVPEFLEDPVTRGGPFYQQLNANGINFARLWISSLYGSAWSPWVGGRNRYNGYLPVTGLMPFQDGATGDATWSMRLDYEPAGDTGWFDACRVEQLNIPEPVKPNTNYDVRAVYSGRGISGPRNPRSPGFGFVLKMGGMFPNCYEPGTSRPVTNYGLDSSTWTELHGVWNSGARSFLPKVHLALDNVREGAAYVKSVSRPRNSGQTATPVRKFCSGRQWTICPTCRNRGLTRSTRLSTWPNVRACT